MTIASVEHPMNFQIVRKEYLLLFSPVYYVCYLAVFQSQNIYIYVFLNHIRSVNYCALACECGKLRVIATAWSIELCRKHDSPDTNNLFFTIYTLEHQCTFNRSPNYKADRWKQALQKMNIAMVCSEELWRKCDFPSSTINGQL